MPCHARCTNVRLHLRDALTATAMLSRMRFGLPSPNLSTRWTQSRMPFSSSGSRRPLLPLLSTAVPAWSSRERNSLGRAWHKPRPSITCTIAFAAGARSSPHRRSGQQSHSAQSPAWRTEPTPRSDSPLTGIWPGEFNRRHPIERSTAAADSKCRPPRPTDRTPSRADEPRNEPALRSPAHESGIGLEPVARWTYRIRARQARRSAAYQACPMTSTSNRTHKPRVAVANPGCWGLRRLMPSMANVA